MHYCRGIKICHFLSNLMIKKEEDLLINSGKYFLYFTKQSWRARMIIFHLVDTASFYIMFPLCKPSAQAEQNSITSPSKNRTIASFHSKDWCLSNSVHNSVVFLVEGYCLDDGVHLIPQFGSSQIIGCGFRRFACSSEIISHTYLHCTEYCTSCLCGLFFLSLSIILSLANLLNSISSPGHAWKLLLLLAGNEADETQTTSDVCLLDILG